MEKIEKYVTSDGRQAEKRTEIFPGENGENKIVHEILEEERLPKALKKRIVEIEKPVIVEREIQYIDKNEIVKTEKEALEPEIMQSVATQKTEILTKKDIEEAIQLAIAGLKTEPKNLLNPLNPTTTSQMLIAQKLVKKSNKWNIVGGIIISMQIIAIIYLMLS